MADLFMVNGHVYPEVDRQNWGTSFAERSLLFHNEMGKKFTYVAPVKGSGLAVVTSAVGRRLATCSTMANRRRHQPHRRITNIAPECQS